MPRATRRHQRARPARGAARAGASSSSTLRSVTLPSRPSLRASHGRATRHAAIATYAEPASDEEEEEEEEEDGEDGGDDSDNDEEDDDVDDEIDDDDDDADFDDNFAAGRRAKRPRTSTSTSTSTNARPQRSSPRKRRRLLRRRPSASAAVAPPPRSSNNSSSTMASMIRDDRRRQRARRRTARNNNKKKDDEPIATRLRLPPLSPPPPPPPPPPSSSRPAKKLPWEALPYMVLVDVFAYASHPLDTVESSRWLAGVLRTCRAFTVPGLRVLYERPPLLSMNMAHSLLDMLSRKRSKPLHPYHGKIRTLSLDVALSCHSYKGRRLDIAALVAQCPRLAHLELHHSSDGPPYRGITNMRYAYTDELFAALGAVVPVLPVPVHQGQGETTEEEAPAVADGKDASAVTKVPVKRLKSWRYNYFMIDSRRSRDPEFMLKLHQTPAFASLTKIALVNFPQMSLLLPAALARTDQPLREHIDRTNSQRLARALAALPCLTHLVMESCAVLTDDNLVELLPSQLEHLELRCCNQFTASTLAAYLVVSRGSSGGSGGPGGGGGQRLRTLTLHHNRSLNLGFLTVLGTACPRLEELRMNLTCYSPLQFSGDSSPLYEQLLTADQVPTWPTTLRVVHLENMRRWDAPAADMFFQSLVDAAPRLPHLRVLVIKAMLNIPWRQRSEIRDRWVSTLDSVFLRPSTEPEPARSLEYYKRVKDEANKKSDANKKSVVAKPVPPPRRSTRITAATTGSSLTTRLGRIASRQRSYREPDTDDDELVASSSSSSSDDTSSSDDLALCVTAAARRKNAPRAPRAPAPPAPQPVHGMCDVVDVKFDNQKPVEVQFTMEDFEDTEPDTGDDEWTE